MNLQSQPASSPVLRLVGRVEPVGPLPRPADGRRNRPGSASIEREIARENRSASLGHNLDPLDPRWLLAVQTRSMLQGSALTVDRRERLMGLAHQLGMRPFDASLVIAIVQDEARTPSGAGPLPQRLQIISSSGAGARAAAGGSANRSSPQSDPPAMSLILAAALLGLAAGALLLLSLIRWLLRG